MAVLLYVLWSFLWAGYLALDGYDLGVGSLFTSLGRSDSERRLMINSIGPVWNGNEVWLITAGGVTFAAFPAAYASIFSGFYSLIAVAIAALVFRGVVFDFRNQLEGGRWTGTWDAAFTAGSILPAFLFGLIFGNIFRGVELDGAGSMTGTFWSFFNPYALLTGVLFVVLFAHHGALWLAARTAGGLQHKARSAAGGSWFAVIAVAAGFAVYTGYDTALYDNYRSHPGWFVVPGLLIAALLATRFLLGAGKELAAFLASSFAIAMLVFFAVVGLYPNLLPSTLGSTYSITINSAAASRYALILMAVMLLVFMPLVIAYQLWVYGVFRHRLHADKVMEDEDAY